MDERRPLHEDAVAESVVTLRPQRGGRAARRAARKAGVSGLAVQPGMEGGHYKPLSDRDIERIHDSALDVLDRIGIGDPIPEILDCAVPNLVDGLIKRDLHELGFGNPSQSS